MAETKRSSTGAEQPITRHPLFPAIVALWCGAIAGLCSLAVSSSTIEGLVLLLGIDKVLPMAAPPLGATMRILFALSVTVAGALVGALATRRLVRPGPALEQSPLLAGGNEHAADALPQVGTRRRRARTIEPEAAPVVDEDVAAPSDTIVADASPSPATETPILNVADFEIAHFDEAFEAAPFRRAPPFEQAPLPEPENFPVWLEAHAERSAEAGESTGQPEASPPPGAQIFRAAPQYPADTGAQRLTEARPDPFDVYASEGAPTRGAAEGPGFSLFAPSREADAADAGHAEPVDALPPLTAEAHPTASTLDASSAERAERIAGADLATLSQVELVERLAIAMERRRDSIRKAAREASSAALASAATGAFPVGGPNVDTIATGSEAAPLPSLIDPRSARPADPREDAETSRDTYGAGSEHAYGGSADGGLGVVPFPANRITPDVQPEGDGDEVVLQQGYSSLLSLSRQAAIRKPVLQFGDPDDAGDEMAHSTPAQWDEDGQQGDDDPADAAAQPFGSDPTQPSAGRPFDAPGSGKTEATEKALRDALATLQRMSGVG
ncbi:hypothetical protein [Novosphingobium panipatense]|uniref:Uncharacterized protein n=2 Tax=Novosphingobium panipatense TaxID=428991 RepID=A0ABY1QC81_9SPHN|nr:hypothetical protein [Novosphingobium panipatense]SMP67141.1 hypothetical protein SAMN06296065_104154 [Novosphingobium panipatense]